MGKGTICAQLASKYEFIIHVSVGDVLRAEAQKPEAEHGTIIKERMQEGLLVPNLIVQEILENFLVEKLRQGEEACFLLDGFPRSIEQAVDFQERVSTSTKVSHVSLESIRFRSLTSLGL